MHVVDGSLKQPEYEYDAVRLELEMFSLELAKKLYLVMFNKMDLPEAYENGHHSKEGYKLVGSNLIARVL